MSVESELLRRLLACDLAARDLARAVRLFETAYNDATYPARKARSLLDQQSLERFREHLVLRLAALGLGPVVSNPVVARRAAAQSSGGTVDFLAVWTANIKRITAWTREE